jgi:hypothetical protein
MIKRRSGVQRLGPNAAESEEASRDQIFLPVGSNQKMITPAEQFIENAQVVKMDGLSVAHVLNLELMNE